MSTIATQLNWGSSYIMNDFYRRFVKPDEKEKHYVLTSRVITIILMLISIVVTLFIGRISGAWEFIMEAGAGVGLVLILRWFWWRINAWSEISAMITPFVVLPFLRYFGIAFPTTLFYLVSITTLVWLFVTFLTKPTDEEILVSFYKKIHPGGVLWKKISSNLPDVKSDVGFFRMFLNWIFGVALVYSMLLGIGNVIFGDYKSAIICLVIAVVSIIIIYKNLSELGWKTVIK
jgi:Na+/proline symporter